MISAGFEFDRAIAASNALYDYFCAIIADRRSHPSDDVISVLVQAELDGERLDDAQICSFLRLLLPAGAAPADRVRVGAAHVPRVAPRPHGDARRAHAGARPTAEPPPRSRRGAAVHHRHGVPRTQRVAGGVGLT